MEPLHTTAPPHISNYRLTARLGAGGMGQVYLALTPSGRKLVVKVIRPELADEDGFRARFAREADAARRVGGFHTAQVVDADPDAAAPWIATAHIPGPTLGQAVRDRGPLASPDLHVLALGLAEGLKAVHACNLVHRDLKPGNIILSDEGPRIIDFGIARPLDADSMTTQGAVFGTLPYMSPEQTDGSRVGPASDIFSLGTVLAYAATGISPFSGATMAETLRRVISPPPDPGDIDPATRDLIAACWNHDPAERPTPDQILARFSAPNLDGSRPPQPDAPEEAAPSPEETPPPHTPTTTNEKKSGRWAALVLGTVGVVGVIGAITALPGAWDRFGPDTAPTAEGSEEPGENEEPGGEDPSAEDSTEDSAESTDLDPPENACRPEDVIATFDFADPAQEVYGGDEAPEFRITLVNTGDQACIIDAETTEIRISSGDDRVFSTTDCSEQPVVQVTELDRGVPHEYTFTWERERSFPDCRDAPSAPAGWYSADLLGDYVDSTTSLPFQLEG